MTHSLRDMLPTGTYDAFIQKNLEEQYNLERRLGMPVTMAKGKATIELLNEFILWLHEQHYPMPERMYVHASDFERLFYGTTNHARMKYRGIDIEIIDEAPAEHQLKGAINIPMEGV